MLARRARTADQFVSAKFAIRRTDPARSYSPPLVLRGRVRVGASFGRQSAHSQHATNFRTQGVSSILACTLALRHSLSLADPATPSQSGPRGFGGPPPGFGGPPGPNPSAQPHHPLLPRAATPTLQHRKRRRNHARPENRRSKRLGIPRLAAKPPTVPSAATGATARSPPSPRSAALPSWPTAISPAAESTAKTSAKPSNSSPATSRNPGSSPPTHPGRNVFARFRHPLYRRSLRHDRRRPDQGKSPESRPPHRAHPESRGRLALPARADRRRHLRHHLPDHGPALRPRRRHQSRRRRHRQRHRLRQTLPERPTAVSATRPARAAKAVSPAPPPARRPSITPASSKTTASTAASITSPTSCRPEIRPTSRATFSTGNITPSRPCSSPAENTGQDWYPAIREQLIARQNNNRRQLGRRSRSGILHRHGADHLADAQSISPRLQRQRPRELSDAAAETIWLERSPCLECIREFPPRPRTWGRGSAIACTPFVPLSLVLGGEGWGEGRILLLENRPLP